MNDNKTQPYNFTLYPRHIAIIDAVGREKQNTDDPRHNRSRALRRIIDEYGRLTALLATVENERWEDFCQIAQTRLAQPPAASDRDSSSNKTE